MEELKPFPTIKLYKGATSIVKFNFSKVQMDGGYLVFTMKKEHSKQVLMEIKFDEQKVYDVVFQADFTKNLYTSEHYIYDIMLHLDDERFPLCDISHIVVQGTAGGKTNGWNC